MCMTIMHVLLQGNWKLSCCQLVIYSHKRFSQIATSETHTHTHTAEDKKNAFNNSHWNNLGGFGGFSATFPLNCVSLWTITMDKKAKRANNMNEPRLVLLNCFFFVRKWKLCIISSWQIDKVADGDFFFVRWRIGNFRLISAQLYRQFMLQWLQGIQSWISIKRYEWHRQMSKILTCHRIKITCSLIKFNLAYIHSTNLLEIHIELMWLTE